MSDEKEVVNADEYAAMRKELVVLHRALYNAGGVVTSHCCILAVRSRPSDAQIKWLEESGDRIKDAIDACPIAAELSKQEGGN